MEESIVSALQKSVLGAGCSPAERLALAERGQIVALPCGQTLFEADAPADAAYVLLHGMLEVVGADGTWLASEQAGALVGEQALLPGAPGTRSATIRATEDARLLRVDAATFSTILHGRQDHMRKVAEASAAKTRNRLGRLSGAFQYLLDAGEQRVFADGSTVFAEGDPADGLHLIVAGRAEVYAAKDAGPVHLTTVHAGQCFGELATLKGIVRTASVVAGGELRTVFVPAQAARDLHEAHPELASFLDSLLRTRTLPRQGRLHQRSVFQQGQACIETVYELDDGRELRALRQPEGTYTLSTTGAQVDKSLELAPGTTVSFDAEHRVVALEDAGQYDDIAGLQSLVMHGVPLSVRQRRAFRATARQAALQSPEAILCRCLGLSRATLQAAIDAGATTHTSLQAATGCGTVCGGCMRKSVPEMLPETSTTPEPTSSSQGASWFKRVFGSWLG